MREGDMPKGYFLSEVDVANPEAYEAYRTRVLPTVEKFGGRFLVRGGQPKAIEGGGFANRVIVIEFDSAEQVMPWYNCPEYQAIVPIRHANAKTRAACLIGA
jgi:uncharacterized protein (DUF1330 family)